MSVTNGREFLFFRVSLDKYADGDALLNIENIFILRTIRGTLFFLAVSMKIEKVNIIECFHQALTHATEGGIIQITMIANERENTVAGLLDPPLGESNKFHVIIIEPLRVSFDKWLTIYLEIISSLLSSVQVFASQQSINPRTDIR